MCVVEVGGEKATDTAIVETQMWEVLAQVCPGHGDERKNPLSLTQ